MRVAIIVGLRLGCASEELERSIRLESLETITAELCCLKGAFGYQRLDGIPDQLGLNLPRLYHPPKMASTVTEILMGVNAESQSKQFQCR